MHDIKALSNVGSPIVLFNGRIVRLMNQLVEFPDGTQKMFEYAERPPGVRILLTDGKHILITKEWRHETGNWDYRLPGGKIFDRMADYDKANHNSGFDLEAYCRISAQRELAEETSLHFDVELFKLIHVSKCGATVFWDLYYYALKTPKMIITPLEITTHEGEEIVRQWLPNEMVKDLCISGEIKEDRTVAVLLKFLLK